MIYSNKHEGNMNMDCITVNNTVNTISQSIALYTGYVVTEYEGNMNMDFITVNNTVNTFHSL